MIWVTLIDNDLKLKQLFRQQTIRTLHQQTTQLFKQTV